MEQPTIFSCTVCGDEFATVQQLKLHHRENHPETEVADALHLQLEERPLYEERGELF